MESTTSLPIDAAAQWNKDLMQRFHAELRENPAADLMSMFPASYCREHRNAQYLQLSYAAQINLRTLNELYDRFITEPEINFLSVIPNYNRRITMATGPRVVPKDDPEKKEPLEFRTRLELAETAKVVFPLSEEVTALLAKYSGDCVNGSEKTLILPLKKLLWDSPKLWESYARRAVVKCNDNIVAKVIFGNVDYTEHTSMEYLAKKAPDIPAPRPHGLIDMEPFQVIFMSYIPGITLAKAWPSLAREAKLSIQHQLDDIFCRLRSIQHDTNMLGGVCGEGAKELRIDECAVFKDITTATEYSQLQFSAKNHGSATYIELLRSLLKHDNLKLGHELVFTHGDVRTANIMVRKDPDVDDYIVTGIIDWEDSGFYPAYHECTVLARTMSVRDEDDWYSYLPESISPSKYPVRWLVDRLWGIHLRTT